MNISVKTFLGRNAGPIFTAVTLRQIARAALLATFRSPWSAL